MQLCRCCAWAVVPVMIVAGRSAAVLQPFAGFDRVMTPSVASATNSLSAESAWLAAAAPHGSINHVDFESAPLGVNSVTHAIAPGVSMLVQNGIYPDNLVVMSGTTSYGSINGFNSTPGGSRHMRYESGPGTVTVSQVTFTFDQPICGFSLFVTGEGTDGFLFDQGMTTIYPNSYFSTPAVGVGDFGNPYWPSTAQPDVRFGGFVDYGASISTVIVKFKYRSGTQPWHGSFSVDDVRWIECIPVPSTGGVAVAVAAWRMRRRRERVV